MCSWLEWPHRGIEDFSPPPSIPHRHAPSPTTPFPLLRYPPPLLPPHVLLLEVCHTLPRSRLPPRPLLALEVWEVQLRRVQVLRVLEQVETTLGELGVGCGGPPVEDTAVSSWQPRLASPPGFPPVPQFPPCSSRSRPQRSPGVLQLEVLEALGVAWLGCSTARAAQRAAAAAKAAAAAAAEAAAAAATARAAAVGGGGGAAAAGVGGVAAVAVGAVAATAGAGGEAAAAAADVGGGGAAAAVGAPRSLPSAPVLSDWTFPPLFLGCIVPQLPTFTTSLAPTVSPAYEEIAAVSVASGQTRGRRGNKRGKGGDCGGGGGRGGGSDSTSASSGVSARGGTGPTDLMREGAGPVGWYTEQQWPQQAAAKAGTATAVGTVAKCSSCSGHGDLVD
ncbi:unnamed protein product [Closterium sp. NIES-53]